MGINYDSKPLNSQKVLQNVLKMEHIKALINIT